jgi:Zn-dependent protease with chaperone function
MPASKRLPMHTLHIANKNYSSWSLRPWLVLKTLGIPFTEIIHPFARRARLISKVFRRVDVCPALMPTAC